MLPTTAPHTVATAYVGGCASGDSHAPVVQPATPTRSPCVEAEAASAHMPRRLTDPGRVHTNTEVVHSGWHAGLPTTQTTQLRRHEHHLQASACKPSRLVIIGVTGEQGSHDFDGIATTAGLDAVWGKPFPSPEQMRDELARLFESRQRLR